jgi:glycosyltransferase involved in cell wall biosynthesis
LDPYVSICIPAYKEPNLLARTLNSIVIQIYQDYEVIITDDSPDDSVEKVVAGFRGQINNLFYYKNEQLKGSPSNWNESISHASGKYIKILHHDDWFANKNSLGAFIQLMEQSPETDFGFSACYACNEDGSIQFLHKAEQILITKLRQDPRVLFLNNFVGAPSVTIFKRDVGILFDTKLKWTVDLDFYMQVLNQNQNYAYNPEPLVNITNGASHQVTNLCQNNRQVELFEWFYTYRKISKFNKKTLWRHQRFLINLLIKYNVNKVEELRCFGACQHQEDIPIAIKLFIWFWGFYNKIKESLK